MLEFLSTILKNAYVKLDDTKKLFFGQILAALLSLFSTIWIARYMGASLFGFCISTILVLNVILDVIDFGSCSLAAREYAKGNICIQRYLSIMQMKVRICLLLLFLTPILFFAYPPEARFTFIFLLYPALWIQTNYIQQFLIAVSLVGRAVCLQILERFFWLLYIPMNYFSVDRVISFILPIILGLMNHAFLGRKAISNWLRSQPKRNESCKDCTNKFGFSQTKNFGITSIVSDAANLDSALIAHFSSFTQSGIYSLCARFRLPSLMGFQAFATKMRPIASKTDRDEIERLFVDNRIFLFSNFMFILIGSLFALFFAENIFGSSYSGLNFVFSISIITSIPNAIILVTSNFLSTIGQDRYIARMTFFSVASSLGGVAVSAAIAGSAAAVSFLFFHGVLFSFILLKKSIVQYQNM